MNLNSIWVYCRGIRRYLLGLTIICRILIDQTSNFAYVRVSRLDATAFFSDRPQRSFV